MYKDDLIYEYNDDMWYLYHEGNIDCVDTFVKETHQWLENKVIYSDDCKEYCTKLNADIFEEHPIFGRANNWYEAGLNALWDLLSESEEALTFNKMKLQNENA